MKIYIGKYPKDSTKERKVSIRIDKWDTWNMDYTLAMIILPMLIQLKKDTHGAPNTDDEDVPEELRSTSAPAKENDWDTDDNHFKRWDWILDEMIWAFGQKNIENWEEQFYSGKSHTMMQFYDENKQPIGEPVEWDAPRPEKFAHAEMVKGPNDTFQMDMEGLKKHHDRMKNGFRLFGKYYENLWD